ncbi:MAG: LapA family protein [Succinatimonas sp.]|nr:LapA family protein [Succinatimonas sp.]
MLKKWLYAAILLVLFAIGLALGAFNDTAVDFDFLFVKAQMPLGMILIIGVFFGFVLGIYMSFLMCFKYWRQSRQAKAQLRKALKENSLSDPSSKSLEK